MLCVLLLLLEMATGQTEGGRERERMVERGSVFLQSAADGRTDGTDERRGGKGPNPASAVGSTLDPRQAEDQKEKEERRARGE